MHLAMKHNRELWNEPLLGIALDSVAEGSLPQLQEKFAEKDLEELFFRLISETEGTGD